VFAQHDIGVVYGLGGVGKSSLACEYAWRNRNRYSAVWWLDAQTEESIIEGLVNLGATFVAGLDNLANRRTAAQRVLDTLPSRSEEPILLIFDNLDDERHLRTWLPRSGAQALITSRKAAWSADVARIPLKAWPLENAVDYLQQQSGRSDFSKADAQAIAEALGALPLALAHAAASLHDMRMLTPQRYLKHILTYLKNAPRNTEYPRSIFATFKTAIAQAETEFAGASATLCFAAAFAPDGIPDELFRQPIECYTAVLRPMVSNGAALDFSSVVADEVRLDEALGVLDRLSLLVYSEGSLTYSMHRLVQLAAQDLVGDAGQTWRECAVAVANAAFPDPEVATWQQCSRLLPHVRASLDALSSDTTFLPAARLANQCAVYLRQRSDYVVAQSLHERALAILETALGPSETEVTTSRLDLGRVYCEQELYTEAETLLVHTRAILEEVLGCDHIDVVRVLNGLAIVYTSQRRYQEAAKLYARVIAALEKTHGPEDAHLSAPLSNLAGVYFEQAAYEEAESLLRRALAIDEKTRGTHPIVALHLFNLATMCSYQERYIEAERLHGRALSIRQNSGGPNHPDVAASLNALAEIYQKEGRYKKAESQAKHALRISEELGSEHPSVALSLSNLASAYRAQGRDEEAEALFIRALAIRETVLGQNHPQTIAVRGKLTAPRPAKQRR
jgi:tetratricopeptide (TPR) repeat protein